MKQEAKHNFDVPTTAETVWNFLWDVQSLAQCIPGCGPVEIIEEQKAYKAQMKRKVGPFLLRFNLEINILEADAPRQIKVEIFGSDKRLKTTIKQLLIVNLTSGSENTNVDLNLDMELTGVLVTLGKRLAVAHINQILDDFVATMQERIRERI